MAAARAATADPYGNRNADRILVSRRQEGNPVLRYIRNVKWEMADIVPDFLMGRRAAAIFISLRFHRLRPGYLYGRLRELQRSFRLRVVLVHVDVQDPVAPLEDISKLSVFNEATLVCGFSPEECGRILETYKAFESKGADTIQEKTEQDYVSRLTSVLTTIRGVNRTDALTLGSRGGSLAAIFTSEAHDLQVCPGIGDRKLQRMHEAFHRPFTGGTRGAAEERVRRRQEEEASRGEGDRDREKDEQPSRSSAAGKAVEEKETDTGGKSKAVRTDAPGGDSQTSSDMEPMEM